MQKQRTQCEATYRGQADLEWPCLAFRVPARSLFTGNGGTKMIRVLCQANTYKIHSIGTKFLWNVTIQT